MKRFIEKLRWFDASGAYWPYWRLSWGVFALVMIAFISVLLRPAKANDLPRIRIFAQVTSHGTTLTWTASQSAAGCTPTATPPCSNFGYNLFRGTIAGGEGAAPINASLVTATTYFDPVTLTSQPQTFFYFVQAVETVTGFGQLNSPNSSEVSASFPAIPQAPVNPAATPK